MQRDLAHAVAPERAGSLPDVLGFTQDLWALAHSLDARSRWMHRTYGVSGPQRLLARVIGLSPGCTPGEAARLLHLHPATVTRLVARLERLGLVRRARDLSDARRLRLTLTARGRRVNGMRTGTIEQAVTRALARAGQADVAVAWRLVHTLTKALRLGPQRRENPAEPPRPGLAPRPRPLGLPEPLPGRAARVRHIPGGRASRGSAGGRRQAAFAHPERTPGPVADSTTGKGR